MNTSEFEENVEHRIDMIRSVLTSKGEEYAVGGDRLHNFKVAARVKGETMEKALEGMRIKHDVSIMDMINNPDSVTEAMIDEKIGDRINYDVILSAIFLERIKLKKEKDYWKFKDSPKVTPIEALSGGHLEMEA